MSKSNKVFIPIIIAVVFFIGLGLLVFVKPAGNNNEFLPYVKPRMSDQDIAALTEKRVEAQEKLKENSDSFEDLITVGNLHYALGELKEAKEIYLKAAEMQPENFLPHNNLANVLKDGEDFKGAEKAFLKAIELSSANSQLWYAIFDLYQYQLKKSEMQMKSFIDEALGKTNRSLDILSRAGRYYEEIGKVGKAIPYWQEILKAMPDNEAVRTLLEKAGAL